MKKRSDQNQNWDWEIWAEAPVIAWKKVLKNNVGICAFYQAKDSTLAV